MRFDEDGSFIGQYGTLERNKMQQKQNKMSSNGFHRDSNPGLRNNSFDSSHLRNGNGIIPSSTSSPNQNHQNHIYSKSAAGGTYV
jgi:hypothetical protein